MNSYPPLTAGIAMKNAAKAIEFYKVAFGAIERYRLVDPESGVIGHAELTINGGLIMIAEEYPAFNKSPHTLGGTTVKLCLMVDNVDGWVERAVKAGATVVRPASDQFYGFRSATIRDPFGHEWMLQREFEPVTPEEMQKRWNSMVTK